MKYIMILAVLLWTAGCGHSPKPEIRYVEKANNTWDIPFRVTKPDKPKVERDISLNEITGLPKGTHQYTGMHGFAPDSLPYGDVKISATFDGDIGGGNIVINKLGKGIPIPVPAGNRGFIYPYEYFSTTFSIDLATGEILPYRYHGHGTKNYDVKGRFAGYDVTGQIRRRYFETYPWTAPVYFHAESTDKPSP